MYVAPRCQGREADPVRLHLGGRLATASFVVLEQKLRVDHLEAAASADVLSEKIWLRGGLESVLQVRAARLSEDGRADRYWKRPRPHGRAAGASGLGRRQLSYGIAPCGRRLIDRRGAAG